VLASDENMESQRLRSTRAIRASGGGAVVRLDETAESLSAADPSGNRTSLTYPGGTALNYTYDALERVSRISSGANARAVYSYVGPSRRSQVALMNGASTVSTLKMG